jgi:hypothetical protein
MSSASVPTPTDYPSVFDLCSNACGAGITKSRPRYHRNSSIPWSSMQHMRITSMRMWRDDAVAADILFLKCARWSIIKDFFYSYL